MQRLQTRTHSSTTRQYIMWHIRSCLRHVNNTPDPTDILWPEDCPTHADARGKLHTSTNLSFAMVHERVRSSTRIGHCEDCPWFALSSTHTGGNKRTSEQHNRTGNTIKKQWQIYRNWPRGYGDVDYNRHSIVNGLGTTNDGTTNTRDSKRAGANAVAGETRLWFFKFRSMVKKNSKSWMPISAFR